MRLAFGVSQTCALRRSCSFRTRRMSPARSMLRSAITVVGSMVPTRSDNSRCESPSSVQRTRKKYHWPRLRPKAAIRFSKQPLEGAICVPDEKAGAFR